METAVNTVHVLYATDRLELGAALRTDGPLAFANGKNGPMITFGDCTVTLGPGRNRGTDNPSIVTTVQKEPDASWATRLEGQEVLMFVHGYNNSFQDAIKKAAQVKMDMPWKGPIVAFSWPSYGDAINYLGDEAIYQSSLPAFRDTLKVLQGSGKVHIISHSMGNRITSEALLQYDPAGPFNLGQLVFAAPDIDAEVFAQRLAQISALGEGRTMYMSSMDSILEASAVIHDDNRAGQVWPRLLAVDYILRRPFVLVPGTDSIDCSGLNVGVNIMHLNYDVHGYYAQPPTLDDIRKVLSGKYPAAQRLSNDGQDGLTAVQAQPNRLLEAIQELAGQAPPQLPNNATWYRLDPPAPAQPQPPAVAAV